MGISTTNKVNIGVVRWESCTTGTGTPLPDLLEACRMLSDVAPLSNRSLKTVEAYPIGGPGYLPR